MVDFSCKSFSGNGHLLRDRATCQQRINKKSPNITCQIQLQINLDGGITNWSYNNKKVREMHARFIDVNNLPINFGDNPYWQECISQAYCL